MKKVLLTGSEGFIGGYVVKELLEQGYKVVGIDNLSKYGQVIRNHSKDSNYEFVEGDVKDRALVKKLLKDCDYLIAGAAMIGGISYFHEFEYDLLSENEKIISSTIDTAIEVKNESNKLLSFINSTSNVCSHRNSCCPFNTILCRIGARCR